MRSVFISGSIAIKKIPNDVKESINKIMAYNFTVLVGDAPGVDTLVQKYLKDNNYSNTVVYSIHPTPRRMEHMFKNKYIPPEIDSIKERELQKEKDIAMSKDSDYSLIVWDGKSNGSYNNILRAFEYNKKVKVFYEPNKKYLESRKINKMEISYIFRRNNGYAAKEIVDHLISEGEYFFKNTREFNSQLLKHKIIMKENSIYKPVQEYADLFIIDKYRGQDKGIKFKCEFIDWVEKWIKEIKMPQQQSII